MSGTTNNHGKVTGKYWWQALTYVILAGGIILAQLTFGTPGGWKWTITQSKLTGGFNLTWGIGSLANYLLLIVTDAAFLWLLTKLLKTRKTVADALHFWLLVFAGGGLILVLMILTGESSGPGYLYNAVFILSRGAFPPVTAIFFLLLFQPWLSRLMADRRVMPLLWTLLSLNLLFNRNAFGLGTAMSIPGMLILGLIALAMVNQSQSISWRQAAAAVMGGIVSLIIMGLIQSGRGLSMATTARFVASLSPLTLIPALFVVRVLQRWFRELRVPEHSSMEWLERSSLFSIIISAMLATGYSIVLKKVANIAAKHLTVLGSFWVLPTAIALIGLAFVASGFAWLVMPKVTLWKRAELYWSKDLMTTVAALGSDWRHVVHRLRLTYWRPVTAFFTLLVVQATSMIMMNTSFKAVLFLTHANDNIFASYLFGLPHRVLGGLLILLAAYWIVLSVTNRYWVSLLSITVFDLVFSVINRLKILSRSEPVVPSDLNELGETKQMLSLVSPGVIIAVTAGTLLTVGLIVFLEWHSHSIKAPWYKRLAKFALGFGLILSLCFMNTGYPLGKNILAAFWINPDSDLNMMQYAQANGPVISFLSQMDIQNMEVPSGYSRSAISRIVDRYKSRAKVINQSRVIDAKNLTMMFNLSESFADPGNIPGVKLNKDPIPYTRMLKKQTTAGEMISAGFGGGTANMEYMSLTGMSMAFFNATTIPNNQVVTQQALAPNIGNLFSYDAAIHPYTGGYYNRPRVYAKYGFNKFAYLGSQYKIIDQTHFGQSPYLSDTTAYANALAQLKTHNSGGQFLNLITIQNHMPYTTNWYPKRDYTVSGGPVASSTSLAQTYTQGIAYTDNDVKAFKAEIDKLDKPIIWVFYGDHQPGFYTMNTSVPKYSTDYFIYANKYARDHGALTKLRKTKYVSTDNFIAMALAQGKAKVNAYTALLTDVYQKLPALWQSKQATPKLTGNVSEQERKEAADQSGTNTTYFVTEQGQVIDDAKLTKRQKQLLKDYRLIQFDITSGQQYSLKMGFSPTVKKTN